MGYKVILVDDEPKILRLIRLLGHWETYNIEIIDECHDGMSALESIRTHHPDFVISDIKMPDLDGLELIQETRKAGIDSLFILLSGYRQFEYARSAIALNVVDYLLKPIDEEKLNKTLERVCREIEQRREDNAGKAELMRIREGEVQARMEPFWDTLVLEHDNSEMVRKFTDEETLNAAFGTDFRKGCYQMIMIVTNISGMMETANLMMNDEIERLLASCFNGRAACCYAQILTGYSVILNYPAEHQKSVRDGINAVYYGIHNLTEIYGEFLVNIGVSGVHDTCRELLQAADEARAAEWGRLIMTRSGVLDYHVVAHMKRVGAETLVNRQELDRISSCMKYLRLEELGDLFDTLYRHACAHANCYPNDMAQAFFLMTEAIVSVPDPAKHDQLQSAAFQAYINARNFPEVIKNLYLKVEAYVRAEMKNSKEKVRRPISAAMQFIEKNYMKPIGTEDVAEASHVSAAYLSRLFKEEMNIGFHEYLTQIRLEEAERLLAGTGMSIKDVAAAVGYPDEKYFSRLFRKQTGIKPSEYRRIYG